MIYITHGINNQMAFNEGGMASGLLIIGVSIIFAAGLGFLIFASTAHFIGDNGKIPFLFVFLGYFLITTGELFLSPIGLSAFSQYAPKKYVGQMFGLWFLASAIGGVLAGLLGGEALGEGLERISPVFEFMIQYYVVIGLALVAVAVFGIAKSADEAKAKTAKT